MKKRALSLVMALCLALGMAISIGTVSYAEGEVTTSSELLTAIEGVSGGALTITLGNNITMGDYITIPAGEDITIDLNGNELRLKRTEYQGSGNEVYWRGAPLTVNGTLTISDTGSGGTVIQNRNSDENGINGATIEVKDGGTLNLTGGDINSKRTVERSTPYDTPYVHTGVTVYGGGTFNMTGGKISWHQYGVGFARLLDNSGKKGTIEISGGSIEKCTWGAIEYHSSNNLTISGNAEIYDNTKNINNINGAKIKIGELTEGAKISFNGGNDLWSGETVAIANSVNELYITKYLLCDEINTTDKLTLINENDNLCLKAISSISEDHPLVGVYETPTYVSHYIDSYDFEKGAEEIFYKWDEYIQKYPEFKDKFALDLKSDGSGLKSNDRIKWRLADNYLGTPTNINLGWKDLGSNKSYGGIYRVNDKAFFIIIDDNHSYGKPETRIYYNLEGSTFSPVTEKVPDKPVNPGYTPTPSYPSTPTTPSTPSTPATPSTPSTPSTPAAPQVTIPITGGTSVEISGEVKDNSFVLNEITAADLDKTINSTKAESLVLDFTSKDAPTVNSLEISKDTAKILADYIEKSSNTYKVLEVKLPDINLEIKPETLKSVIRKAQGDSISIYAKEVKRTDLTPEAKNNLIGHDIESLYNISFKSSGNEIHTFDGEVNISIPYSLKEGQKAPYFILYNISSKRAERIPVAYENGAFVASLSHMSEYLLAYDKTQINDTPGSAVRFFNPKNGDHIITANPKEFTFLKDHGWEQEGLVFSENTEGVTIYRLFNKKHGDHLFSKNQAEIQAAIDAGNGWELEGIAFKTKGETPMYRLFNTTTGRHHYTANPKEKDMLLEKSHWTLEGIAFNVD